MAVDGQYAGHIVISDVVKPNAKAAIAALHKAGVEKTVMLTGDAKTVADAVAAELGVDEVHSELLPGDKVAQVEQLLARQREKAKLAFVGDGINDAPVLSRADIGIAMGAMGSRRGHRGGGRGADGRRAHARSPKPSTSPGSASASCIRTSCSRWR